jgi:mannose-6-phosphate isomerase-like protein (cupin superfamily)
MRVGIRIALLVGALLGSAAEVRAGDRVKATQPPATEPLAGARDAATILASYAEAWRGRQEMPELDRPVVIGFAIADHGDFHIVLPLQGAARLAYGPAPDSPDWVTNFETDLATLQRIDRGEISALTAIGKARADDPAPLELRVAPAWSGQLASFVLPLNFHFWTRGWPEVVRFGEGTTRLVHGANAAVLYYEQGLRSAFYQFKPGMHANADPADRSNPFKSLLIIVRGHIKARLDGTTRLLREGEALLVPAGMAHEFWADDSDYGEAILLMFGEGA